MNIRFCSRIRSASFVIFEAVRSGIGEGSRRIFRRQNKRRLQTAESFQYRSKPRRVGSSKSSSIDYSDHIGLGENQKPVRAVAGHLGVLELPEQYAIAQAQSWCLPAVSLGPGAVPVLPAHAAGADGHDGAGAAQLLLAAGDGLAHGDDQAAGAAVGVQRVWLDQDMVAQRSHSLNTNFAADNTVGQNSKIMVSATGHLHQRSLNGIGTTIHRIKVTNQMATTKMLQVAQIPSSESSFTTAFIS